MKVFQDFLLLMILIWAVAPSLPPNLILRLIDSACPNLFRFHSSIEPRSWVWVYDGKFFIHGLIGTILFLNLLTLIPLEIQRWQNIPKIWNSIFRWQIVWKNSLK